MMSLITIDDVFIMLLGTVLGAGGASVYASIQLADLHGRLERLWERYEDLNVRHKNMLQDIFESAVDD